MCFLLPWMHLSLTRSLSSKNPSLSFPTFVRWMNGLLLTASVNQWREVASAPLFEWEWQGFEREREMPGIKKNRRREWDQELWFEREKGKKCMHIFSLGIPWSTLDTLVSSSGFHPLLIPCLSLSLPSGVHSPLKQFSVASLCPPCRLRVREFVRKNDWSVILLSVPETTTEIHVNMRRRQTRNWRRRRRRRNREKREDRPRNCLFFYDALLPFCFPLVFLYQSSSSSFLASSFLHRQDFLAFFFFFAEFSSFFCASAICVERIQERERERSYVIFYFSSGLLLYNLLSYFYFKMTWVWKTGCEE